MSNRRGDHRQGFGGASEIFPSDRLVVRDHDRHAGRASGGEALFEAVEDGAALVAHMRRIERPGGAQQPGQGLDLGGRRARGRGVGEAARHADRAGVERFLQSLAHPSQLGVIGRPVERAHRSDAQRRMADEACRVERRRRLAEGGEILGETAVTIIGVVADQIERRRWRFIEQQRREADPAIAGHHGGNALAGLGRHFRGVKKRAVVVGVHVDKTGRDDLAADIHFPRALDPANRPDGGYAVTGDRHIGTPAGPAAAVDHLAAAENPIGHFSPRCVGCHRHLAGQGGLPEKLIPRKSFCVPRTRRIAPPGRQKRNRARARLGNAARSLRFS